MDIKTKTLCYAGLIITLSLNSAVYAGRGGFNGGFRGGSVAGDINNQNNHGDNYRRYNNNYNGVYNNNLNYDTGVVVGVPVGGDDSCQSTQVCNPDGQCWTQQQCD